MQKVKIKPPPQIGAHGVFFSGYLGMKNARKAGQVCVSLLTGPAIQVGDKISSLDHLKVGNVSGSSFSLTRKKEPVYTFYAESEEECKSWVHTIRSLVLEKGRHLLDFLLWQMANYAPITRMSDFIKNVFCSDCITFVLDLFTNSEVKTKAVKLIARLFQTQNKLEFLLRTILMAEISTVAANEVFRPKSRYGISYLTLFVVNSKAWLVLLAINFVRNKIGTAEQFFELLFLAFARIPPLPFLIVRTLCLTSAFVDLGNEHPMIPFFEFLFSALHVVFSLFFEEKVADLRKVRARTQRMLRSPDQLKSSSVRLLAPFYHTVLQRLPLLEEITLESKDVDVLYKFLGKNIPAVMTALKQLPADDPKDDPLYYSYLQSVKFACQYPPEVREESEWEQVFGGATSGESEPGPG
jgi:hypothetical protein